MVGLATDAFDEPIAQGPRREQEVVKAARARVAGEEIQILAE
jgi:hypothetical protein